MKMNILGMIMVLLLVSAGVYAADMQTNVVLTKNDSTGKLNAYVLAFDFTDPTADPAVQKQVIADINTRCVGLSGTQYADCVYKIQAQYSVAGKVDIYSLKDAKFTFSYWDPVNSKYAPIQGCEAVLANTQKSEQFTSSSGLVTKDVYYASCDFKGQKLPDIKSNFQAVFAGGTYLDKNGQEQNFKSSDDSVDYIPESSNGTVDFNNILRLIGTGFEGASGLPCVGAFVILGLMLATMYARGSPMSLLNIQTPKLPTPKGVGASGQIVVGEQGASKVAAATNKQIAALGALGLASSKVVEAGFNYKQQAAMRSATNNIEAGLSPKGAVAKFVFSPDIIQVRRAAAALVIANGGTPDSSFGSATLSANANKQINAAVTAALTSGNPERAAAARVIQSHAQFASFRSVFASNSFDRGTTYVGKVVKKIGGGTPKVLDAMSSGFRTARMVGAGVVAIPAAAKAAALATAKAAAPKSTALLMAGLARRQKEVEEGKPKKEETSWTNAKKLAAVEAGAKLIGNEVERAEFHVGQEIKAAEMASLGYVAFEIMGKTVRIKLTEEEARGKINSPTYDVVKAAGLHLDEKGRIEDPHLRELESRIVAILSGKGDASDKYSALLAIAREEGVGLSSRSKANIDVTDAIKMSTDTPESKLRSLEMHFAQQARETREERAQHPGRPTFVNYADHDSLKTLNHAEMLQARASTMFVANMSDANGKTDDKSAFARALRLARIEYVGKQMGLSTDMEKPFGARYSADVAEHNKKELIACMTPENMRSFKAIFGVDASKAKLDDVLSFVTTGAVRTQSTKENGRDVTSGSDFVGNAPNMGGFRFPRWDLHTGEEGTVVTTVEERLGRSMVNPLSESIAAQLARMGAQHWTADKYRDEAHKLMLKEAENQALVKSLQPYAHGAYGEDGRNIYHQKIMGIAGILQMTLMDHYGLDTLTVLDEQRLRAVGQKDPKLLEGIADLKALVRVTSGKLDYEQVADVTSKLHGKYESLVTARLAKPITEEHMAKLGMGYSTSGSEITPLIGSNLKVNARDAIPIGIAVVKDHNGQWREVGFEHADFGGRLDLQVKYQKLASSSSAKDAEHEKNWNTLLDEVARAKDKMRDSDPDKLTMTKTYIACLQARDSALGHKTEGWDRSGIHVLDPQANAVVYKLPQVIAALGGGEGTTKTFNTVYSVMNAWAHGAATVMQKMGGADFVSAGSAPVYWTHAANEYGNLAAARYSMNLADPKYAGMNSAWNQLDASYRNLYFAAIHNMDRGAKNSARFEDAYRSFGATVGNWTSSQAENGFARAFSRAANWFTLPIAKAAAASQFLSQGDTGVFDRESRKDSISYLYASPSYLESMRAFFGFGTSKYANLHGFGNERAKGYLAWDDKDYVAKGPGGKTSSDIHNPGVSYVDAHGRMHIESSSAALLRLRQGSSSITNAYNQTVYTPSTDLGALTIHQQQQREQIVAQNPQLGFMGSGLKFIQWGMQAAVRVKNGGRPLSDTIVSGISGVANDVGGIFQTNMDKKLCPSCHQMHKYGAQCSVSGIRILWSKEINGQYAPASQMRNVASGPSPRDEIAAMREKQDKRRRGPGKIGRDQAAA